MNILVTGATGLVGRAIVRELLNQGAEHIRVLIRRPQDAGRFKELGIEPVIGGVLDRGALNHAVRGIDLIFHTAAIYEFWVADPALLYYTAVDGTKNILLAARDHQVQKVVYTSSAITIGEKKGCIGTELTQHRGYFLSKYERAKYDAERVAFSFVLEGSPVIIANPAAVYGPGDFKPTGRSIINALNERVPGYFNSAVSMVYVDDVARAHVLLSKHGRIGERYILSAQTLDLARCLALLASLQGVRVPPRIPVVAGWLLACQGELYSQISKQPPLLAMDYFRHLAHGNRVDGSKAIIELPLRYTDFESGLRKTIQWYWEHGFLSKRPRFLWS
jgi:dihydroflavonol-4-reductase